MADLLSAGLDRNIRLNKDVNQDLPLQQRYLSLRLPHRKVSLKLVKSRYIDLFDERAFNAVNQFITNEASSNSRDMFRTIFNKIGQHTDKNYQYRPTMTFDKYFHLANIYGSGLLSSSGVHRVASWLSSASNEDVKLFKSIMGELKSSQSYSRPISHTHSAYYPLPSQIKDPTLSKTAKDLVEEKVTAQFISNKRRESDKRRMDERKILREKEKHIVNTLTQKQRPSSAPAVGISSHKANFEGKKPYGSFNSDSRILSTNKDHFSEPSTKFPYRPATARIRNAGHKDDRMTFLPKAMMTTASLGVVVPSSDVSFLHYEDNYPGTRDRKQRFYSQLSDSEVLSHPPPVSKTLSAGLNRTTYSAHYNGSTTQTAKRVTAPESSLKAPFGFFPTAQEMSATTEYNGRYNRRSLTSTYSPGW